ncbi:MAG TPA: hypothetical protein VIH82_11140 [Acidimicrobiia bacterium]
MPDEPTRVARAWSLLTGDDGLRWPTVVAWAALVVVMVVALVDTLTYDFRVHPIVGDEASHLFTTLSLSGPGHNLSYGFADLQRFNDLHWVPRPYGIFFQQYGNGWAYAKPYGYGVYAAPFAWVFGTVHGVAVANSVLLVVLAAASIVMLRLRYRGPVVPLTVGVFVFLGLPLFYAYVIHPDLLLAVLTAIVFVLVLLHWQTRHAAFAAGAFAVSTLLIVENPRAVIVVLPVFVVVLWELRSWAARAVVVGVGAVAFAVVITPNLVYSNGDSWNAYGGARYQAIPRLGSDVPFDGVHIYELQGWRRIYTGDRFSTTRIVEKLFEDPVGGLRATYYTFFGRNTGILVFVPLGFLILALVLARVRSLDAHAWAILGGVLAYVLVYAFAFPTNYYGGGQSLGNRYFLQIAPSLLALAVAARVQARALTIAALAGAVLSVAFLWPHFEDPSGAYSVGLARTSWLQRRLPAETGIYYGYVFKQHLGQ